MAQKKPQCSIRFERADRSGLRALQRHDLRQGGNFDHVDLSRSHLNRDLVGSSETLLDDVDAHIQENGARIRPNVKAPFISGICTVSPEYFRDDDQGPGEYNEARTQMFADAVTEHLEKRFGNDLIWAAIDLDEETPHVDFVVANIHRYKTKSGKDIAEVSPGKAFAKGRDAFAKEQDAFAESLSHLGIERGARGSTSKHENPRAYEKRMAREAAADREQAAGELKEARELKVRTVVEAEGVRAVQTGVLMPRTPRNEGDDWSITLTPPHVHKEEKRSWFQDWKVRAEKTGALSTVVDAAKVFYGALNKCGVSMKELWAQKERDSADQRKDRGQDMEI